MADKKAGDQFYTRPPVLGKWEGFKTFLWNNETNQFMGRTAGSWAKIIFFYIVFYAALVGFFAAMLAVFYQTLDANKPKWQLDNGLIGANPGLGFRPMPPESNVESTLIWYEHNSPENVKYWVDELDAFLEIYRDPTDGENRVECNFDNPPEKGKVCLVNVDHFEPCTSANKYNYPLKSPCIFLKLNKIYNWVPDVFNDTTNLPKNMPQDLVDHIKEEVARGTKNTEIVWVSCEGENPADLENLGAINYLPRRGFPKYYFPFTNIKGYQPPLVVVHLEKPKTGVLINIECKAWARNIHHDRAERRGSVHFELMID